MFENEGTEIESTQSDVTQDSSSESQVESQTASQESEPKAKEMPFHEHPRWKEVMEERNAERQRAQALEQRIAEMQRQFMESQKAKTVESDPTYDRLKGIDPEFADYLKDVRSQASLAKQLQEELNSMKQEQFVNSALGKFDELTKANNVSPELANLYKSNIDLMYREGKIKTLGDLEKAYTELHGNTSKFLQAQERSIIEKYTASKKQDAKAPAAQSKGRAPSQSKSVEFSKNPQEAKAQLVKHIANSLKAGRDI
jgi:hypothetical protein